MNNVTYERWVRGSWRPAIGWLYFICVLFDFVLAPVGYSVLQVLTSVPIEQWEPLTLKGAGLFHISMLTIVGATAYGRTQEKIAGMMKDNKLKDIVK
jgi:hypothetical protein